MAYASTAGKALAQVGDMTFGVGEAQDSPGQRKLDVARPSHVCPEHPTAPAKILAWTEICSRQSSYSR